MLASRAHSINMNQDTAGNDFELMIANAQSEDEVAEILKLYDEQRQAAEDHLKASLATASPPMRDAAVIRSKAAAAAKMSPEPLDSLESLIANAQSEDEVAEILKLYDEQRQAAEDHLKASLATASPPMRDAAVIRSKAAAAAKMSPEPLDSLESLIVNAQSEDEVAEILKLYDEQRQAAEDHLKASLATASPPMRDAAVIRSKAASASANMREEKTTDLEACIIDAKSEDGVQLCMQMHAPHSESVTSRSRPRIRIDVDSASCYQ